MKQTIRVMIKEPGEVPYMKEIPNELHAMQDIVGGLIETFQIANNVTIICDEEGKLKDKPFSFVWGRVLFVGTCIFCGVDGAEFTDFPYKKVEDFYFDIHNTRMMT